MLPILKKQSDYTELSKEVKVEKDTEQEAEKDNAKKDWLSYWDTPSLIALHKAQKKEYYHYHFEVLSKVSEIEVRPPKC